MTSVLTYFAICGGVVETCAAAFVAIDSGLEAWRWRGSRYSEHVRWHAKTSAIAAVVAIVFSAITWHVALQIAA